MLIQDFRRDLGVFIFLTAAFPRVAWQLSPEPYFAIFLSLALVKVNLVQQYTLK